MPKAIAITAIQKKGESIPAGKEFEASKEDIDELIAKGAAKLPATKPANPKQDAKKPEDDQDDDQKDTQDDQKPTGKQPSKTGATGSK